MNDLLRRAAAHVLVDDVDAPELDEQSSHHVFRVLRVRDGESVTVTDGAGRWRVCRAVRGEVEPEGKVHHEPTSTAGDFELYVAIPKQGRPEWLVQKATELGASRIVWLHADRSVVTWSPERARTNLDRFRSVVENAAMQSRRVYLPSVEGPVLTADVLAGLVVAEPGGRPMATTDRAVAIGPEGGWSERELAAAAGRVGLGPHVLRVETAALAACVIGASPNLLADTL